MRFNLPINTFTSGEWSPKMSARTDVEQYPKSSRSLKNAICQVQGGAFRRAGTQYINLGEEYQEYINEGTNHKMFPYTPSFETTSYVLVTMKGLPSVAKWFVVNSTTGGVSPITVSAYADYDASILNEEMQYSQNGDYLFIVSKQGPPRVFYKEGSTFYLKCITEDLVTNVPFKTVPYENEEAVNSAGYIVVTGTLTAGGSVTLTATGVAPFAASQLQLTNMIPYYIKLSGSGSTGAVKINGITSSSIATGIVVEPIPGTSGSINFGSTTGSAYQLSSWGGEFGWPKTVTGHQGRMYYGGTSRYPSKVFASRIGNAFDMNEIPLYQDPLYTGFSDDNSRPFTLTPSSKEASVIVGLSAAKTLVINTNRTEIVAYGQQGALGPNDFNFESSTSFGAEFVQPVRVNNFLTFVQRGGKKLRDVIFSFDESQYKSNDLSFTSDHLVGYTGKIDEMCSAEIGTSILFARTDIGQILSCALDRDYGLNAWTPFVIGGDAFISAICTAPQFSGTTDQLWMIAVREINGVTQKYLERLIPIYEGNAIDSESGINFPYYLDSWSQSIGVFAGDATEFGGFTYLAGEDVDVFFSGFYAGTFSINTSGVLTVPATVLEGISRDDVIVGLPYETIIEPNLVEAGSQIGSSLGRTKRVDEVSIKFWNSGICTYGNPETNEFHPIELQDLNRGGPNTILNEPELFTGTVNMKFPNGYSRAYRVQIKTSKPFPMNILSVSCYGTNYD